MFSGLFAAYAVLWPNTAGGPSGSQLFDLKKVFVETACLLLSSYTWVASVRVIGPRRCRNRYYPLPRRRFCSERHAAVSKISEFAGMVASGAGPSRSAFLSAFFTLVGMHGAHVTGGLLWLLYMVAQVAAKGLRRRGMRRLSLLAACSGTRSISSGSGCSRWSI